MTQKIMEINIFKTVTIIDRENSLKYINKKKK